MNCDEFIEGQKIKITKTNGTVVEGTVISSTNYVMVTADRRLPYMIYGEDIKSFEVPIEYRVGDIWEADDEEWFVREWRGITASSIVGDAIIIEPFRKLPGSVSYKNDGYINTVGDFSKKNPKRIRRRDDSSS